MMTNRLNLVYGEGERNASIDAFIKRMIEADELAAVLRSAPNDKEAADLLLDVMAALSRDIDKVGHIIKTTNFDVKSDYLKGNFYE